MDEDAKAMEMLRQWKSEDDEFRSFEIGCLDTGIWWVTLYDGMECFDGPESESFLETVQGAVWGEVI